ncbi:RidA family protein [Mucilaginibacter sp. KACC 22063]|uniref:RidA family protein n=1 Tax=Mucilaginibacter sp. KACC 22063 TaxID=3025666 RepID=UPI002365F512|nr:RidA family protein [Mucilaginibacter sp. KACC 22063]WDF55420.1 RidA family protein [Mucilaginibacter sp. KACC 22063]
MRIKKYIFWVMLAGPLLTIVYDCNDNKSVETGLINGKSPSNKQKWHWGNKEKQNSDAGYAQVVKVDNTMYVSGVTTSQISIAGVNRLYKELKKCLDAFGASPSQVVKETLYTTDIELMKKCNEPRKIFYKGDFPAATWVQIDRLYEKDAKLEVDFIVQF